MSSSDDDAPLAHANGHGNGNGHVVSKATISRAEDRAMDKMDPDGPMLEAPVSIRNGPVIEDAMDIDAPYTNGKRKGRGSLNGKTGYKEASDSDDAPMAKRQKKIISNDSDDDAPLTKRRVKLPPKVSESQLLDDSDSDDKPLTVKLAKKKKEIEKAASAASKAAAAKAKKAPVRKTAVKNESDSDDAPLASGKARKKAPVKVPVKAPAKAPAKALAKAPAKAATNGTTGTNGVTKSKPKPKGKTNGVKKEDSDSDSDAPVRRKARAAAVVKGKGKAATKKKEEKPVPAKEESDDGGDGDEDEDDDGEAEEWWNNAGNDDDTIKWTALEHNGVMFAPDYEPLPKNTKLMYDGVPVTLHVDAEEVATFFGSMLHSTLNVENPVFQKNFMGDFLEVLKETGGAKSREGKAVKIKDFEKLDFRSIFEYYQAKSQANKNRSAAEKKTAKAEKDEIEAPYMFCKWNGKKEKVGNFRVEPPGLFRGRGEHPKTGRVKRRVHPEQITINIGKESQVPAPPEGHKWKAVQHDQTASWLAMWKENVNGQYKYVQLAANSTVKGKSDYKKFEKARELKKYIDKIRKDYTKDLRSDSMADRQRATAIYLIDKLALRAGNEKDTENEAETVGCCSLKFEHITLKEPETVIFDFLGKDSIRFYDEVTVERQVFKNLKIFKKAPKGEGDDIFDRLNTGKLNKYLSSYMKGLTAKVFRTFNASFTMSKLLHDAKVDQEMTIAEKIAFYNTANREVAILCNHKRTVGASHEAQMEKMGDRIKGLQYQKWRNKMMMLNVQPKEKKKRGAEFFKLEEGLDDAWVAEHITFLVDEQRTKVNKKFEKENEKLEAEGEKPQPEKELKERLKAVTEFQKKMKAEYKSKKVEAEGKSPSVEKYDANISKLDERINTLKTQAADREGNKEVALGTSKINYIDPRLTVVFSKKFDVPIERFFSKTLREKFNWAIQSVKDGNWEF